MFKYRIYIVHNNGEAKLYWIGEYSLGEYNGE